MPQYALFAHCLCKNIQEDEYKIKLLKLKASTVKNNVILMIPKETGLTFFLVHVIFKDIAHELYVYSFEKYH